MAVTVEYKRWSKRVTSTVRWRILRAAMLERDGWKCVECSRTGRLEIDHILPVRTHPHLAYEPKNLQSLCISCHTKKTRIECGGKEKSPDRKDWDKVVDEMVRPVSWSIPIGLKPSAVPVTIVCGPPGSGKSTFIKEKAGPQDTVIDFDNCLRAVGGIKWDSDRAKVRAAFRLRDSLLCGLADQRRGRAWFIVTAPTSEERAAWKRKLMRAQVVLLAVDAETCKARILAAPERQHAVEEMCASVDRWWRIYAANLAEIETKHTGA